LPGSVNRGAGGSWTAEQPSDAAKHAAEHAAEAGQSRQLLASVDVRAALPESEVRGDGPADKAALVAATMRAIVWRLQDLYGLCQLAPGNAAARGVCGDQRSSDDGWDSDAPRRRQRRRVAEGSGSSDEGSLGGKADASRAGADGLPRLKRRPKQLPTSFVDASLLNAVASM
jgi:hypothetical protein